MTEGDARRRGLPRLAAEGEDAAHLLHAAEVRNAWLATAAAAAESEDRESGVWELRAEAAGSSSCAAPDDDAAPCKMVSGVLSHGQLPGIKLSPFTAHSDDHQKWKAASAYERERIHAVADTARLHEKRRALATKPGTCCNTDTFLL